MAAGTGLVIEASRHADVRARSSSRRRADEGEERRWSSIPWTQATIVVALIVAGACSGLELHRVFDLGPLLVPVIGAAVLSGVLAVLARRLSSRVLVDVPVQVLGYVLFTSAALFRSTTLALVPTASTLSALRHGLVDGWARILTTAIPADPNPVLMTMPVTFAWMASGIGCTLALRTRLRLAAAIPSVVLTAVAVSFGVGGRGSRYLVPALLAVAVAAVAAASPSGRDLADTSAGERADFHPRSGDRSSPLGSRPGVFGSLALVVLLATAGAAFGPSLPGASARTAFDPRALKQPDPSAVDSVNPLSLLSGWAQSPQQVLFDVRSSKPVRMQLAVLDRFDGQAWTSSASYGSVGSTLPTGPARTGVTERVRQAFTIRTLDTAWVPAADRPISTSDPGLLFDRDTGVLVRSGANRPGQRYVVTSSVRVPDVAAWSKAPISSGPGSTVFLEVPKMPAALVQKAQDITSSAPSAAPYAKAALLERYLAEHYRFDPKGPSGNAYPVLERFVGIDPDNPDGPPGTPVPGTSEQFATTYAVMARSIGLPTRVVVGFHAGTSQGGGRYVVHATDAYAWPEVWFDGPGWIAFDPTPKSSSGPTPPEKKDPKAEEAEAQNKSQADIAAGRTPADTPPPATPRPVTSNRRHAGLLATTWAKVVAVVIGLAVLLVAYAFIVLGWKARRRRRRRSGTASQQVRGAWRQLVDALHERGVQPDPTATTHQVARTAVTAVTTDAFAPADALASLVDRALFGQVVEADLAESAWRRLDEAVGWLDQEASRRTRLRCRLDPRPLRNPV